MKYPESDIFNATQLNQLKKLVARGEGLTLEFKRKATFPEKVVREMIAFANTKGGILLVGIGDDGSIPGLKYPEDESFVLTKELQNCTPLLTVIETFIPIGNSRTVLQYEIPESQQKPHSFNGVDIHHQSYVRVDDKSIKASREVKEIAKRLQQPKDIRFYYGEHEKFLMQYLDVHGSITLMKFRELSRLKKFYASKKLVLLVLADVLRITPHEKGDVYTLAFQSGKINETSGGGR